MAKEQERTEQHEVTTFESCDNHSRMEVMLLNDCKLCTTVTECMGLYNVNQLYLLSVGRRDGQTMMVRQVNCVEAYQWSAAESRWIKVGNVVGGSNDSQTTSGRGKTWFEGKVYYILNCLLYLVYS